MKDLLKRKLEIQESNDRVLTLVRERRESLKAARGEPLLWMEEMFRLRCLERLGAFLEEAVQDCETERPVIASMMARGVMETAGLLVLFDDKMKKKSGEEVAERTRILKQFIFATRKFSADAKAVHAMDCVRALRRYSPDAEELYDILCEAVHPNWLGVTQFKGFERKDDAVIDHEQYLYATILEALSLGHAVVRDLQPKSPA